MNSIVVPVDFSDASYNSANYAAMLSNIFNAKMILVHAYKNPSGIDEMPEMWINQPEKELQEVKEEYLQEDVKILQKKYTIDIKGIVREGTVPNVIAKIAADENAELIVIGMKGKGKTKSVFGSTTTMVMGKSKIPVLVIPQSAGYKNIQVITLASDFDVETQLSNYSILKKLAKKNDAVIQILNVRKKDTELTPVEASGKLNTALAFEGLNRKFYTIKDDNVDEGIEDFLDDHLSDMLAMVARRRNLFGRIFSGSHTRKMSYETEIPLLVLQDK